MMTRSEILAVLTEVSQTLRFAKVDALADKVDLVLSDLRSKGDQYVAAARSLGSKPPKEGSRPRGRPPVKRQGA